MSTVKFTVPNWGQAVIARAAKLDPNKVVVRSENERNICFLQHMPRKEFFVDKITGDVLEM